MELHGVNKKEVSPTSSPGILYLAVPTAPNWQLSAVWEYSSAAPAVTIGPTRTSDLRESCQKENCLDTPQ